MKYVRQGRDQLSTAAGGDLITLGGSARITLHLNFLRRIAPDSRYYYFNNF
jgi:hypothetical protein